MPGRPAVAGTVSAQTGQEADCRWVGPARDVAKLNCTTWHQGAYKPHDGVSMAKDCPAFSVMSAVAASLSPWAGS